VASSPFRPFGNIHDYAIPFPETSEWESASDPDPAPASRKYLM